MDKWNMIIDVALCTNCNNCVVSAQEEFMNNEFEGYSRPGAPGLKTIDIERHIRGRDNLVDVHYVPTTCNHCDEAPCMEAGKDGAVYKRKDGIVMFDPVKAQGRRDLVDACPYGAVVWNEQENVPQNWYFDAHLLDQGWKEPRCVQSCPTGAMRVHKVTDEAMQAIVEEEGLEVLKSELGTKPRVYYKNIAPTRQHFIAGNVSATVRGELENISSATVRLLRDNETMMQTRTDDFGDFKFDGLDSDTSGYAVVVSHGQFDEKTINLSETVTESKVLSIQLDK